MSRLFIYTSGTTTGLVDIDSIQNVIVQPTNGVLSNGKTCGIQDWNVYIGKMDGTNERVYTNSNEATCQAFAKSIRDRIKTYGERFATATTLTATAVTGDIKLVLSDMKLTYRNGSTWTTLATGN